MRTTHRRSIFCILLGALSLSTSASRLSAAANSEPVKIEINANQPASYAIPRTIFGTFLEPIGNSTYNGLWAEILQNPSFEENLWSAPAIARMIRDEPALAKASQLALPLPWEPLNPAQGNRYEPRWGSAANSWRSLAIFGIPGAQTGIKQKVFLPVDRQSRYTISLYVKHISGPAGIDLSFRRRNQPGEVFAHSEIEAADAAWRKHTVTIDLPPGKLIPLEPADFVIQVKDDERVLVDQASIMPVDAVDGMDPDMLALAKAMKTPLVRFGGNFTSAYHWRDGIGPRDKRVSMLNVAWGIPEYNQFGTDEFLRFCQLIGAQPQIALNLGSGTPAEAADWVRYVNLHWSKHRGLLWELGNELWGDWNLAYPTLDQLAARTRQFSEAIRRVDPKAQLIATGQDPDVFEKWNAVQLTNPANTFNYLSTHFVVTTDKTATPHPSPDFMAESSFALPVELGRRLRAMQEQINKNENFRDKAHIAFTEWLYVCCGGGNADAPRFDNMGGAIGAAGFFNMLIQNADIVPVSDMTGIVEFAGIWKKRGRVYAAPSYYAFRLYSTADIETPVAAQSTAGTYDVHRGVTRLPEIANVPYLDVVAALNKDKSTLTLFCVNRSLDRDIPATITLDGFAAAGKAEVESLSGESIYEGNSEISPTAVIPVHSSVDVGSAPLTHTFKHESVTRIELHSR
jgi:alpha-N-arabinofuranosidase